MDWQPFSTAPRDGSKFIAWDAEGSFDEECICFVVFWQADHDCDDEEFAIISNAIGEASEDVNFTHWMPLPKPPVQS